MEDSVCNGEIDARSVSEPPSKGSCIVCGFGADGSKVLRLKMEIARNSKLEINNK